MKRFIIFAILIIYSAAGMVSGGESFVTKDRQKKDKFKNDPLAIKAFDPAFEFFPDSSLVDFSYLLSPPAGQYGFVKTTDDGHFAYSGNNEKVRFWGVVVSQEHVDIPKERISEIVENLAHSGVNMLRLHAFDNRGGEQFDLVRRTIIDDAYPNNNDSQHFDRDVRDRIDWWISECKQRGIYVYLVLRAYRTFKPGDDVPNSEKLDRAARPYAMFDRRLIDLQKDYAKKFMADHKNPYTNLSYADDPGIAMIEVFNEDSIFMRPEKWQDMVEPYMGNFRKMWNEWLKGKYQTNDKLREAWTNAEGICSLAADESLDQMNITLPDMNSEVPYDSAFKADYKDKLKSPVRRRDAALFGIDVQNKYLREMKDYLHQIGVKVPMTGVVYSQILADTYTVSQELDFPAENAYLDHPTFLPGKEWISESFIKNTNMIKRNDKYSFMPFVSRYHWTEKPVGIREWATCWPNEYRAGSILETAAYARLQEIDMLTFFQYDTTGNFNQVTPFNMTCDPARWGLFGIAAQIYLGSDVQPAKNTVEIGYSKQDITAWVTCLQTHHNLSWITKVQNRLIPDAGLPENKSALLISSGRTQMANYAGIKNAIIYSNCPYLDFDLKTKTDSAQNIVKKSGYDLKLIDGTKAAYKFSGVGFTAETDIEMNVKKVFSTAEITQKGYAPFGTSGENSVGFYDAKRNNLVFASLDEEQLPGLAAQFLSSQGKSKSDFSSFKNDEKSWLISDTEQLKRNPTLGIEMFDTPQIQVIQGEFKNSEKYQTSQMEIQTANPFAVFAAVSLDGKPLKESKKFLIKMMTKVRNRNEKLEAGKHPSQPDYFMIASRGVVPVQTGEKPSDTATVVSINGKKIVESYMIGGWWEMVFDADKNEVYFTSSARNMKFNIFAPWFDAGSNPEYEMTRYFHESQPETVSGSGTEIIYPSFQKYLQIKYKK